MKKTLAILFFDIIIICQLSFSQQVISLYIDSIPNSKPSKNEEKVENIKGKIIISKISRPTLTIFLPEKSKANGTAVIICPGGGYWVEAASHEGTDVAQKFVDMGVAAFVLKYRIPDDAWMPNREIGPLQDAQQAIKMLRETAARWNIDPARIGIMGFSAGGHLAATAGTHFTKSYIENSKGTSLRPNFMILIYPVITLLKPIGHPGSAEQLLGKSPSREKLREYSNELQVTPQTPTTFLVHATDDNGVSPKNSMIFYDSLISKNISAELHIYQGGGHGFGLFIKNNEELWMDRCRSWMKMNGWLKKQ